MMSGHGAATPSKDVLSDRSSRFHLFHSSATTTPKGIPEITSRTSKDGDVGFGVRRRLELVDPLRSPSVKESTEAEKAQWRMVADRYQSNSISEKPLPSFYFGAPSVESESHFIAEKLSLASDLQHSARAVPPQKSTASPKISTITTPLRSKAVLAGETFKVNEAPSLASPKEKIFHNPQIKAWRVYKAVLQVILEELQRKSYGSTSSSATEALKDLDRLIAIKLQEVASTAKVTPEQLYADILQSAQELLGQGAHVDPALMMSPTSTNSTSQASHAPQRSDASAISQPAHASHRGDAMNRGDVSSDARNIAAGKLPTFSTARTLYAFQGITQNKELSFSAGEQILVTQTDHPAWWFGELNNGKRGWFPRSYVVMLDQTSPTMTTRGHTGIAASSSFFTPGVGDARLTNGVGGARATHSFGGGGVGNSSGGYNNHGSMFQAPATSATGGNTSHSTSVDGVSVSVAGSGSGSGNTVGGNASNGSLAGSEIVGNSGGLHAAVGTATAPTTSNSTNASHNHHTSKLAADEASVVGITEEHGTHASSGNGAHIAGLDIDKLPVSLIDILTNAAKSGSGVTPQQLVDIVVEALNAGKPSSTANLPPPVSSPQQQGSTSRSSHTKRDRRRSSVAAMADVMATAWVNGEVKGDDDAQQVLQQHHIYLPDNDGNNANSTTNDTSAYPKLLERRGVRRPHDIIVPPQQSENAADAAVFTGNDEEAHGGNIQPADPNRTSSNGVNASQTDDAVVVTSIETPLQSGAVVARGEVGRAFYYTVLPDGRRAKVFAMEGGELWETFKPKLRGVARVLGFVKQRMVCKRTMKLHTLGMLKHMQRLRLLRRVGIVLYAPLSFRVAFKNAILQRITAPAFALGLLPWCIKQRKIPLLSSNRKTASSSSQQQQDEGPQTRSLFWDAIQESKVTGTIWAKASSKDTQNGTPKVDVTALMPDLVEKFATKKVPTLSTASTRQLTAPSAKAGQPVSLLDSKRAQNAGIALSNIVGKRSMEEVRAALLNLDDELLGGGLDRIQLMQQLDLYKEEVTNLVAAYDGDPTKLALPERFIREVVLTVPSIPLRLAVMEFNLVLDELVKSTHEKLNCISDATTEITTSDRFATLLLDVILPLGNKLNAMARKGVAAGFRLTSLNKLIQTKSATGESFLRFIVEGLLEKSPDLLRVQEEFTVTLRAKGALVSWPLVHEAIAKIDKGTRQTEALVNVARNDGESLYRRRLLALLEKSRANAAKLKESLHATKTAFDDLCKWVGEDPEERTPEALFGVIQAFLVALSQETQAVKDRMERAAKAEARRKREEEAKQAKMARVLEGGPHTVSRRMSRAVLNYLLDPTGNSSTSPSQAAKEASKSPPVVARGPPIMAVVEETVQEAQQRSPEPPKFSPTRRATLAGAAIEAALAASTRASMAMSSRKNTVRPGELLEEREVSPVARRTSTFAGAAIEAMLAAANSARTSSSMSARKTVAQRIDEADEEHVSDDERESFSVSEARSPATSETMTTTTGTTTANPVRQRRPTALAPAKGATANVFELRSAQLAASQLAEIDEDEEDEEEDSGKLTHVPANVFAMKR